MFGNTAVANTIARSFFAEDQKCRLDLHNGTYVSERDYVTAFTTGIRNNVYAQGFQCHAQTLTPILEKAFGCDAIIIFKTTEDGTAMYKIGLFEAKWPRVIAKPSYNWDSVQTSSGRSHFSDQIDRQHPYAVKAVIWEMFFLEALPGISHNFFDPDGSSCIRHQPAYTHRNGLGNRLWNNTELDTILRSDCENIQHIIQDMLMCNTGTPLYDDGNGSLVLKEGEPEEKRIPLPIVFSEEDLEDLRVSGFMRESGLSSYTFIDLNKPPKQEAGLDLTGDFETKESEPTCTGRDVRDRQDIITDTNEREHHRIRSDHRAGQREGRPELYSVQ